jgi:hypothetical protein
MMTRPVGTWPGGSEKSALASGVKGAEAASIAAIHWSLGAEKGSKAKSEVNTR